MLAISADSSRTLYNFYMLILQGPLKQFMLATETETLRNIANWFSRLGSTSYIRDQILGLLWHESVNIIKCNKSLMGSLFAVLELQENASREPGKVVQAFGNILPMADVIVSFYNAYNTLSNEDASALLYRSRWEKTSPRLFRKYLMNNPSIKRDYRKFNHISHSGFFFANLPAGSAAAFPFFLFFESNYFICSVRNVHSRETEQYYLNIVM